MVTFPRNHSHQRAVLQEAPHAHRSLSAEKQICTKADVYQLRARLWEASWPGNMCGWKGNPVLLLAVRYKLHAGGFDDNMVLPPGASLKLLRKLSLKASPRESPLAHFSKARCALLPPMGSPAILGRMITCPEITQHFNV